MVACLRNCFAVGCRLESKIGNFDTSVIFMIFQVEEMILTYFNIFPIEMPKTKICNNIAVTRNEYMVGPGARLLQRKQNIGGLFQIYIQRGEAMFIIEA